MKRPAQPGLPENRRRRTMLNGKSCFAPWAHKNAGGNCNENRHPVGNQSDVGRRSRRRRCLSPSAAGIDASTVTRKRPECDGVLLRGTSQSIDCLIVEAGESSCRLFVYGYGMVRAKRGGARRQFGLRGAIRNLTIRPAMRLKPSTCLPIHRSLMVKRSGSLSQMESSEGI